MKKYDYRQLRAFIAAVAPLGLLTSGCDSVVGSFDGEICQYQQDAIADLAPVEGTDYVAVRRAWETYDDTTPAPETTSSWGTICKTATDATACQAALTALTLGEPPLRTSLGDGRTFYDVVFTQGDDAGRIDDVAALIGLLGTIDTPNEAGLIAFAEGHDLPCGEDNWRREGNGFVLLGRQGSGCGEGADVTHYELTVGADGKVTEGESEVVESGDPNCVIGRRPDGLCSRTRKARTVGQFFANATHLEAASVHAFAHLAGELAAHGAPRKLIEAAWRARADEIRHARATAALSRHFGAEPIRPVVGPRHVRSFFDVARDNGIEGCVRETFGAVVGTAQARRARSRWVRRALGPIAVDETRHAVLSWAIDEWMQSKLSARQRRLIAEGRREAVATLRDETARGWSRAVTRAAGMPTPEAGMRMLEPVDAALWHAA